MDTVIAVSLDHESNLTVLDLTFDICTANKKVDYQEPQPWRLPGRENQH